MLKASLESLGKKLRSVGQSLDRVGTSLEGGLSYTEHLNPSTRYVANSGRRPVIDQNSFVAPNASVIGQVEIGQKSSIWYGAVVRGDINHITIGENTNIQDAAVVHVAKIHNDIPTKIGNNVTIGPSAMIHACTIGNNCIIGTGSQILDGAIVEDNAIVAAGSIVTYGKKVGTGQLWAGVPARYVRQVTDQEKAFINDCSVQFSELSQMHAVECEKSFAELQEVEERSKILREIGKYGAKQKSEKDEQDTGLYFRY